MVFEDRNKGILSNQELMSAEDRKKYQEDFLKEIIKHAYVAGTPLKKTIDSLGLSPADIGSIEDLQKLPITKKKDLSEAQKSRPPFGGFLTVPTRDLARIHQSPGPIYDPVGNVPDYWRWKTALYSVGFRAGDIVVNTFAYHLTPAGHMFEEGIVELGGVIVPTGVGNTETQVDIIKVLEVTGFIGTPSFLMAILKKAEDVDLKPRKDLKLEVAFLAAEMLPESMRRRFLEEYGIIGRQAYGTADVGCVSYECPEMNGMHIHHDVIVEIVDPDTGLALPEGEPGEVVVTCNNKIYPLVRFGTGDLSSITTATCSCGRKSPRLTRIMGRVDQVTKVKGMFVHPSQVQKVVEAHPEIAKARLVVERPGDQDLMKLEIELKGAVAEGFVSKVEATIRDSIKLKGSVSILEPGALGGEHKIIDDRRKWD
ncbi:MAG: AMP-binding protein [Deltaproteobacteria bacterium]|nr:AMP-binding protein [Deltaproteobacteria bacterium]